MNVKTILVVDDETEILELAVAYVENCFPDAEVLQAKDGLEGLEKFRSFAPDLVISDVKMPRMNGLELVREIRKTDHDVIIVLTSGDDKEMRKKEAQEVGADAFLSKPYAPQELQELILMITAS